MTSTRTEPRRRADDLEEIAPPNYLARRVLVGGILVVLLGAIVAAVVLVWAMRQIDPGPPGPQIASVEIPRGAGLDEIATLLEEQKVLTSATVFRWYARFRSKGSDWKAGTYVTFRERSPMADVIDVLDEGPVPPEQAALTIVPGTRVSQQLEAIAAAFPGITVDQLNATLLSGQVTSKYLPAGASSWEGLLAPETYAFPKEATARDILQRLADQQVKVLDELGYDRAEALAGRSAYELVIIASLIEREAGVPEDERGKIARVIENRLERRQPLGIDASILFGLGRTSGELTASDLALDTPYNTRLRAGLPPTPIAAPSRESLAAAINPPDGPWLYYVLISNDPPTHFFTDSAREFERAKADAKRRGVF